MELTKHLAEAVLSADPLQDERAIQMARNGLLDAAASALAAKEDEGIQKLMQLVEQEGGAAQIPVIGQGKKVSRQSAAMLNGYLIHALDYDDVHSDVRGHPSAVIIPALLSQLTDGKGYGERFLAAYITGVEVMARLGESIGKAHYERGWHNTGTLGAIAAVCAIGYLKQVSKEELTKAIGFAGAQSAGMRKQFGSDMKPLQAGLAAKTAVWSMDLACSGFGGNDSVLDGALGFFSLYGDLELAKSRLLEGYGSTWRIVSPGLWFKVYPFCSAAHHAADAIQSLMKERSFLPEQVKQVDVIFPPGGDAALIERTPLTGEEGRFSVEYVIALAVFGQTLTLDAFTKKNIPSDMRTWMKRVNRGYDQTTVPHPDAVPKGRFTIVKLTLTDGTTMTKRVDIPQGAPGCALSKEDIIQKLSSVTSASQAQQILQAVEEENDAAYLKLLA
ncbi:MmgE/PrpD family protein [Bacillus safensis]|uniref:MmgE/PrpD family protein n=1 Tax=Bacillus safensis TaxID=561879 RepID=UPI0022809A41|nr:MmgE/PrpD family protein [Bacillus safensis]MCY7481751.1 MmgE/PrpD family protein [Bacillus safensis]MCY7511208.1 MmgE/PrpD family protein [Bacillus safensis]MCY7542881.1 MmgE/PrpD family protein [Bacillus safensis]MCY7551879.1 MmgE/PrpD family protein [Bacillus safensis]MCY7645079.1 MmgE/PrpD family protein [Bacillus safensis]